MVQAVRLTMDILSCSTRWPMSLLGWSCRFVSLSWRRGRFSRSGLTADHGDFAVAVRAGWFMFLLGRASLVKLAQDLLVGSCTQVHGQG